VGKRVEGFPEQISGLQTMDEASAVALKFRAFAGQVSVDWTTQLKEVVQRLRSFFSCKLSALVNAFTINSYVFGKFLYHTEFAGLPPEALLRDQACNSCSNGTGQAPWNGWPAPQPAEQRKSKFAGVARHNLVGHPCEGGFGLLPLEEYLNSRQAPWLLQLVAGDVEKPWSAVGRRLLFVIATSSSHALHCLPLHAPVLSLRGSKVGSGRPTDGCRRCCIACSTLYYLCHRLKSRERNCLGTGVIPYPYGEILSCWMLGGTGSAGALLSCTKLKTVGAALAAMAVVGDCVTT